MRGSPNGGWPHREVTVANNGCGKLALVPTGQSRPYDTTWAVTDAAADGIGKKLPGSVKFPNTIIPGSIVSGR